MNNYRDDLKIDPLDLDTACVRQPVLFDMYAQALTPLYKLRDEIKLMIEQTGAKLDGVIREAYSAEGKKITESMVQNEIVRNLEYSNLQQKYIDVCSEVKEHEVIRDAFQQRKDMLKLLVELYISGYWASVTPKVVKQAGTDNLKERLEKKIARDKNG